MFVFAVLEESILEKIYELTYKYGWIKYDEDILGWLNEPAYIAKYKIEGELSTYLNTALEELIETYKTWLSNHTTGGFKEWMTENALSVSDDESYQLKAVLSELDRFAVAYEDKLYQIVEDSLGGSREMIDNEDAQLLAESNGEGFLKAYVAKLPKEAGEALLKEYAQRTEEKDEWTAAAEMIYNYELEEDLKDWMINDLHWTGADYLKDIYTIDDLVAAFAPQIMSRVDELLGYSYDLYLDHFETPAIAGGKSLRENIEDIENALQVLLTEKDGDLDQRIKALQFGLTTAHHHGSMADHLLGMGSGNGEEFLDLLSEGPKVEEWDADLERLLGHPKGSLRKEVDLFWVDPDEQELRSLHGNHTLRLAACISAILSF